ncbi:MAG: PIG-L family deacetylase [Candidatus Bathyarchaeia archaeon]
MIFDKGKFRFYDLERGISGDLNLLFPDWMEGERVAFISPHDDDAILGAGYLLLAVQAYGGVPCVAVMCDGRCGYSRPEDRIDIADRRRVESSRAYDLLGVASERLARFEVPDFCLGAYMEWLLPGGERGVFEGLFKALRRWGATRMLVPNDYREHPDHLAASLAASYIGPQVGDAILADWGSPTRIRSFLKYSVWAAFNPLEAGDLAVKASWRVEERVREAISKFESQRLVIKDLNRMRDERRIGDGAVEVYRRFDPRPRMDLKPYKDRIEGIDGVEG